MTLSNTYKPTVSAIIVNNDGKILITHNKSHPIKFWKFPQGGVEKGETEETAILREMMEELGARDLKIVKKCLTKYRYEWPAEVQIKKGFLGPELTYFIISYSDNANLTPDNNELDQTKWVDAYDLSNVFNEIPEFIDTLNKIISEISEK